MVTSVKEAISQVSDILQIVIQFGMTLILAFVVIDVLFPSTTGVIKNIGAIVGQFSKEGIAWIMKNLK